MHVRPAAGKKLRDPRTRLRVPEAGLEVSDSDTFWARRIADGDAEVVTPEVETKRSAKGSSSKTKEYDR